MSVNFVPIEYSSSVGSHLLHVTDSCSPVLDQYSGDPSSAVNQATGHQLVSLCRTLVKEEKINSCVHL